MLFQFIFISLCIHRLSADENNERIDISRFGLDIFGKPIVSNERDYRRKSGNPEERGPYLEGDLLIPIKSKNGINSQAYRWPNKQIPYEITGSFNRNDLELINRAFKEYNRLTCIKFFPRRQFDQNFISITNAATGCWSSIGSIGGKQIVNLQSPSCTTLFGTVLHELLHAIGFMHEQNREERDGFVTIRSNNIEAGREKNFEKAKPNESDSFGINYDFGSVLHYSSVAFSKNGRKTIEPRVKTNEQMGQRIGLSQKDIEKVNRMYKC